jgi:hypothetical protein
MNKNRTHNSFFTEWNELSCYIFGFWMADGCIFLSKTRDKYYKRFNIVNTDKQIMNEIGLILDHKPILANANLKKRKKHHKLSYVIQINSDHMFDFCFNIINSVNKSSKENQIPEIPDNLFHHFIRGLFDGDGSIHIKRYKTRHGKLIDALQTSFTAGKDTGDFLENLKKKITTFIPVGDKKISVGRTNKSLRFNQYDSMLLCQWMYQNATLYMYRKKNIWDSTDKERLMNSSKYFSNKV